LCLSVKVKEIISALFPTRDHALNEQTRFLSRIFTNAKKKETLSFLENYF